MLTRRRALGLLGTTLATPAILKTSLREAFAADGRPNLRVAVQAAAPTLEPLESISNVGLRAVDCLFDRPLRRNFIAEAAKPGATFIDPQLATSVKNIDPLTWEMTLRPGVKLHDGNTVTAADVVATLSPERVGPKSPFPDGKILFGHLTEIVAVDPMTVRLRTAGPDVVMPHRLAGYGAWILGSKAYQATGPEGFKTKPVGSGPYKLKEFSRDNRIVFSSHDEYWMGKPAAAEVRIDVIPEVATRVAGLISGEYDIITNVLPDQVSQFAGYPDLEAVSVPMDLVHLLFFDTRQPNVADARIRRGLSFAIDYKTLGETIWGKQFARPNNFQIPSFGELYDANRKYFYYDPDLARKLLAEGGYKGAEIIFRIPAGYYLGSEDAAQIIQAMWNKVGVRTKIEIVESAPQALLPGADVRMVSASFRYPDPLSGGVIVHLGRNSLIQQRGFWTPKTDYNAVGDALEKATETPDRRRYFFRMLDILEEEAPVTILYSTNEIIAKRKSVKWTHYSLYYMDLRPDVLSFA